MTCQNHQLENLLDLKTIHHHFLYTGKKMKIKMKLLIFEALKKPKKNLLIKLKKYQILLLGLNKASKYLIPTYNNNNFKFVIFSYLRVLIDL